MIRIYYSENVKDAGKLAADVVTDAVRANPTATIGLATGSSPLELYAELAARCDRGEVSFASVKTVNLDEYVGLAPDHDQSYAYFMKKNLFDKIDILPENTNIPSGIAKDPAEERARYDALLDSIGGVDVQVLGIGNNGHIGFNEPSDVFSYGTILVELTDSTIDANQRFFNSRDEVPTKAISMGIGHIMTAKTIILLANGKGKAEILERSLFGDVTPEVPASILRFAKDVRVFADKDALSVIMEKHPEAVIK